MYAIISMGGNISLIIKRRDGMKQMNNRIRELRRRSGISQEKLAAALNLTQASISLYETSGNIPTDMLVAIAEYFRVSVDYLLCRTDEQPSALTVSTAEYHLLQLYRGLPGRYREAVNAAVHTIRKL
jgi:transcriptional regulator with XRE-family HTH domain